METKEQKAKEYAENLMNESRPYHVEKYGMERAKRMSDFDIYHVEEAYIEGWDEALKSQWVKTEDKLSKVGEVVLVLTSNGKISMAKMYQPKDCHGNDVGVVRWSGSSTFNNSIIAWMPIPSFDEILNNNKDVLKRLKDR